MTAEANRELARRINEEIWNGRDYSHVADYFQEDFVADYSPYSMIHGRDQIEAWVERAHTTFSGFHEEVHSIVADEHQVAVHITITGRQTGDWGTVKPTGLPVEFDEILIMTIRDGKVAHQRGIPDNVKALRALGVLRTPPGQA